MGGMFENGPGGVLMDGGSPFDVLKAKAKDPFLAPWDVKKRVGKSSSASSNPLTKATDKVEDKTSSSPASQLLGSS